jgi:methionine biosynthesis protein MetW
MPGLTSKHPDNHPEIYRWIAAHTPEGSKVLDIGCGDGELLSRIVKECRAQGTGIEVSQEFAMQAIQRGLTVHHGNVEEGLDHYSDGSFDLVVMSLTLQEMKRPRQVLRECCRVGRQVVVVFPNFGHWRARWQLGILGRAPMTPIFPYPWYESPNVHYFTIPDWEEFCKVERLEILDVGFAATARSIRYFPQWRAEVAMYLLRPLSI